MEEETWMVHKQIKRCLIVLAVKEKQNKITVKYCLISHKSGKQKNIWQEYTRQQEHPLNPSESGAQHLFGKWFSFLGHINNSLM